MMVRRRRSDLSEQVEKSAERKIERPLEHDGNLGMVTSTGSTLLDLEITGEHIHGGGIPAGILVEVFGKNSTGKTVVLCEIAGNVQRHGGEVMFKDPEARLNKQFARRFGLKPDETDYATPDTVPEAFAPVREWKPKNLKIVNGVFADSLAALSTELEMGKDEGDKMGMRRAKEFSQECRRTCRIITKNNYLMVCSNQMRATGNTFGPSESSTGGKAIPYYSSLRIGLKIKERLARKVEFLTGQKDEKGEPIFNELEKFYGICVEAFIAKSTVATPYGKALLYILFQYGIDDVRANLVWYKSMTKATAYFAGGRGLEEAISMVEKEGKREKLREAVISLWTEIFKLGAKKEGNRLPKERW